MVRLLLSVFCLAAYVLPLAAYETPQVVVNYDSSWDRIGSSWNQEYPYYNLINSRYAAAQGGSKKWYVGCVATAGNMVEHYYRFPTEVTAAANNGAMLGAFYGRESAATLGVDLSYSEGAYDWDNLDAELKSRVAWNTALASKMHFDEIGTSGSAVLSDQLATAFRSYLGFKSGFEVTGFSKNYPALYEHFIYQQLRIGNPVVLSIAGKSAHCIIANGFGYNSAGEPIVHLSWGWEGSSDGWYKLGNLGTDYNRVEAAIIAIRPNDYYFAPVTGRVTLRNGKGVKGEPVSYTTPGGKVYETETDGNGYFAIAADFFSDGGGNVRVQSQSQTCTWKVRQMDETTMINKANGQPFTVSPQGFINETTYIENKGAAFSVTFDDYESYDPVYQSFPKMLETFVVDEATIEQDEEGGGTDGGGTNPSEPPSEGDYVIIYWNVNGGDAELAPWYVVRHSKVSVPPTPVRQDYRFDGWYYYDQKVVWSSDEWQMGIYGDREDFTAHWVAAPGYIDAYNPGQGEFVSGGGQGTDGPIKPDDPPSPEDPPAVDDGSGTNPVIQPVSGIYRTYGYDMCEDFYEARKQAIKDRKLLFVLSGSASCNYCQATKEYLEKRAADIDPRYVCYYAKQQNGATTPMLGGLPQYGTYDPRTIDAFTGAYDAEGGFHPAWAWYSQKDNAFASARGYSEAQVDGCLVAAQSAAIGDFVRLEVDGPKAVFLNTPTTFNLNAVFSDLEMRVDHGVEWRVVAGKGVVENGQLTATGGTTLTLRATNTFYDFGAEENYVDLTLKVVPLEDIASLAVVTKEFNLEDSTTVRLRCEATLKDGTKAEAQPSWTASVVSVDPYPVGAGVSQIEAPRVEGVDANGNLSYTKGQKWSAQTGRVTYNGTDVQDHVLSVTASINGMIATESVRVWGPSRMWPSDWELISAAKCAPGSVVRVKVNELKYTYGGEIHSTRDSYAANYKTELYIDASHAEMSNLNVLAIPLDFACTSETSGFIRLYARKNGGKYTNYDRNSLSQIALRYFPDWQTCYGVTDSAADDDGDGYTNAEEFVLGTEPDVAFSAWNFTNSHFDWPGNMYYRLMFMNYQFPGRTYAIEGSADNGNSWHVMALARGSEPGKLYEQLAESEWDKVQLYRVRVLLDGTDKEVLIRGYGVVPNRGAELDLARLGNNWTAFVCDANDTAYQVRVTGVGDGEVLKVMPSCAAYLGHIEGQGLFKGYEPKVGADGFLSVEAPAFSLARAALPGEALSFVVDGNAAEPAEGVKVSVRYYSQGAQGMIVEKEMEILPNKGNYILPDSSSNPCVYQIVITK